MFQLPSFLLHHIITPYGVEVNFYTMSCNFSPKSYMYCVIFQIILVPKLLLTHGCGTMNSMSVGAQQEVFLRDIYKNSLKGGARFLQDQRAAGAGQ